MSNEARLEGSATPRERFEYLNDVELWKRRLLPLGEASDLTELKESLSDCDDAELEKTFRILHGNLVDDERALDMVTEELAKRGMYEDS